MMGESHCVLSDSEANPGLLNSFSEPGQAGASAVILLVEDEAFVRRVAAEVLESAGYTLALAASAEEALESCCTWSGTIDLLLADIVMPGMSGRDLATEFKRLYPRSRILLMSGHAEQLAGSGSSASHPHYLGKPFCRDTLLKTVRDVVYGKSREGPLPA